MSSAAAMPIGEREGLFTNPWPALGSGSAAIFGAVVWLHLFGLTATPGRAIVLVAGLIAVGVAIAIQPKSPVILALAGCAAFLGMQGMNPPTDIDKGWDSLRLLLGVLGSFALIVAVIVLLPSWAQRTVVSLLVLFHFGGIVSAVTSVPPQPWLSSVMWTYVYRPYLEFMYLNNAYHFYSPDPGPANLIWAYVKYADGSSRWVKLPNREDFPLAICYQRRLSLTESINQLVQPQNMPPELFGELRARREQAGNLTGIPPHPTLDAGTQYRAPQLFSRKMLASYARYLARSTPHLTDPMQQVSSVKIYRVVHNIMLPRDLVNGFQPLDETSYVPFYQGEYDPDGNLLDPRNAFLYWVIPIVKEPIGGTPAQPFRLPNSKDLELKDYLKVHAELRSDGQQVPRTGLSGKAAVER